MNGEVGGWETIYKPQSKCDVACCLLRTRMTLARNEAWSLIGCCLASVRDQIVVNGPD